MLIFEAGPTLKNETQYVKMSYVDDNGIEIERDFIRPKFHLETKEDNSLFLDEDFTSGRKHIVNDKEIK